MKIKRLVNDTLMEFKLSFGELLQAHNEHVMNFMKDILQNEFELSKEQAKIYAEIAYAKYIKCCGKIEYKCVEDAYEEYCNTHGEIEDI